jgi:ferritin
MRIQYQEEVTHAEKIFDHVIERDGRSVLLGFDKPQAEWKSPLDAFEAAYEHEQKVTAMINNLVNIARSESDHASEVFLQWFVTEQVEEEASVKAIVQQFKLLGDSKAGLFQIDRELGQRTFVSETAAE